MIELIKQLLDWIYRKNCYVCRKTAVTGLLCKHCLEEIETGFPDPIMETGGVKIYASGVYAESLQKIIRGLKYHNKKDLAANLSEILYKLWEKSEHIKEEFEIVPVPLYPSRQKQRKYNQTALVAEEFSKLTGYPVNNNLVKRIKDTKPQYKLTLPQRKENLRGAFKVNRQEFKGKKILLMDDICTTGATLRELISTLKRENINDLYALVIATPVSSSIYQS